MKTRFYFSLLFIVAYTPLIHATVIRVDNNTDASADYVKLQDAINNADPEDTIYVVGSPFYYDTDANGRVVEIRINRQVTIVGPGYFLGDNEDTQFNKQTAKIQYMNIGEGSNNTIVSGLAFANTISINTERLDGSRGSNEPQNINITRNSIYYLELNSATNTLVNQNYFSNYRYAIYLRQGANRTVIRNNVIASRSYSIYGDGGEFANTTITNNTLNNGIYGINGGASIQNNIFITGGLLNCNNNNVKNNIFTTAEEAVFPENSTGNDASDNIFSAVQANLFISPETSIDADYRLAEQSPARGIGVDGHNAGAYGGTDPYRLSGLPAIPAIYDLTTSGIGTPTGGMSVTIKAKSHD